MKTIFLGFGLLFSAQSVYAVPCAQPIAGRPCTPEEGDETDNAKKEILGLIDRAQKDEPDVKDLKAKYLAIQKNPKVSLEKKTQVFDKYFLAQMKQNALYKQAMEKTETLYHVAPDRTHITIGRSDDLDHVSGLAAIWNPQVAEFDKKGRFAVRIEGSDRNYHYRGTVQDTKKGPTTQAVTFEDGRVFVFREVFEEALRYKNPGLLALKLYHESRHYNQLSRPSLDTSTPPRSWASVEEDERDAYKACMDERDAFGVDREDVDALIDRWAENDARVQSNLLTSRKVVPAQEALRKEFYEEVQLNLMDEYFKLHYAVDAEKAKQRELQRTEREERERAIAERDRAATPTEVVNELARCWYRPIYRNRSDFTIIGFEDDAYRRHYYNYENGTPSVQDLKIMVLIMRACDDVDRHIPPDQHKACNDAAPELSNPMRYDLVQNIEKASIYASAGCVNTIMANRGSINDSRSFEKVVAEFHKTDNKKKAEKAKRERKEKERNQREENPGGGSLPPYEKRHYYDPSCNCWVREL